MSRNSWPIQNKLVFFFLVCAFCFVCHFPKFFLKNTLYWIFVNFISCTPIPVTSPPLIHIFHPYNLPSWQRKKSCPGNCSVSQYTLSSTSLYLQMFTAMSRSGMRYLTSSTLPVLEPHWDSSGISCWCPVSWRSCSFRSAGPIPSRIPAVYRSGSCWGGPI